MKVARRFSTVFRSRLREFLINLSILIATVAAGEAILRIVDFRELRDGYGAGYTAVFRYDEELGWFPIPYSAGQFHGSRDIAAQHNSLGLRDIEPVAGRKPTVLFVGDSLTWGYDVEANDRFSDRLRNRLPVLNIINTGVPGYGTDQEYLLLNRIWGATKPDVVVLIFCTANDRRDNTTNMIAAGNYKPYLDRGSDGTWRFVGQPVPWSRQVHFTTNGFVRNFWLARAAVTGYVYFRSPKIAVADPTEQLVGMMRDLVESRGAKFLIGLQKHDAKLEAFLQTQKISFTTFDGADIYSDDGKHWTPEGHALVTNRLTSLFAATGVIPVPSGPDTIVGAVGRSSAPTDYSD